MEAKCNLIIDSCCELPKSLVDKPGIDIIDYSYTIDGIEYVDDIYESTTPHEFYEAMRAGAEPQTAQLKPQLLHDTFEAAIESGVPTVCLSFSGGLSGTFDNATMILDALKQEHPGAQVYLFDTKLACTAEALFVQEALVQRDKGLTAVEMLEWAQSARPFLNCIFMVDDLTSLKRGGRIPSSVAAAGSKLDVKPLLTIGLDGKLTMCGVARGHHKAIKQMVSYFLKRIPESERHDRLIALGQADSPEDFKRLEELLRKVDGSMKFLETDVGPVIGSHVGPGMVSLAFWGPDRREDALRKGKHIPQAK